jgi:hypothetical protein
MITSGIILAAFVFALLTCIVPARATGQQSRHRAGILPRRMV